MIILALIALIFFACASLSFHLIEAKMRKTDWGSPTTYLTLTWELTALATLIWVVS